MSLYEIILSALAVIGLEESDTRDDKGNQSKNKYVNKRKVQGKQLCEICFMEVGYWGQKCGRCDRNVCRMCWEKTKCGVCEEKDKVKGRESGKERILQRLRIRAKLYQQASSSLENYSPPKIPSEPSKIPLLSQQLAVLIEKNGQLDQLLAQAQQQNQL